MTDLIEREDAIKALTEVLFDEPPYLNSIEKCETFARKTLESIPSAEPKQGEWKWNQYDGNPAIGNYHCSICRWLVPHDKYAFCPNCGARMKGEDDE